MTTSYLNDVDFPAVGALVEAVQMDVRSHLGGRVPNHGSFS